jgi:hypothetical protein
MRRPLILGLLLAGNALSIAANVILFYGDRNLPRAGLVQSFTVLAALAALLSAAWLCILVLRLPAEAAVRLWLGFVVLGSIGLVSAVSEWVLHREYDDTFGFLARIPGPAGTSGGVLNVSVPAYQPDSEVVLLIAALVTAAAWFAWAAVARRDGVRQAGAAATVLPPGAAAEPQV